MIAYQRRIRYNMIQGSSYEFKCVSSDFYKKKWIVEVARNLNMSHWIEDLNN